MAYAPRKKKSLWDNIVDTVGGAADKIIPGDQSTWRSGTTRANNAPVQTTSRPQAHTSPIIRPQAQQQYRSQQQQRPSSIFDEPIKQAGSLFKQAGSITGKINDATFGTGVNVAKSIGGITQRAVGTGTQAATGVYGLGDALSSQIQGKTDEANEKSRKYTQLIKEMGNGQAIDGGRTSFMSTNTLEGKSKPTDFAKEYIAAGVDTSSLLPIGNVAKGVKAGTGLTVNAAKKIFVSNAKQAPIYGTSELVNDKVQGREITPTSVAMNYGAPLLLGSASEAGGVMLGSAGRQAGKTAKVVNNKLEQANPRVKELDRARVTMQKAFDVETDPKRRAQINQGLTKLNKERESLTQGGYINGDKPRNQVDDMLDDAITPKPKTVKVNSDLERLQQRRAEFQKNPAEVEARVQAETPEVPQHLTREDIQARLTEMQVDPRNFNNVSMSSLQNIFENTDFSKIKNPGGFIRSELDRLAQSNADNPSITAMRNNVTQQRLADEAPVTAPKGDYDTVQNGVEGRVINGKFHAKPEFNKEYPTYGQKELVQPKVPIEPQISTPQPTNLGTMVQDFYDNKAGNQKISFRDVEDLGIRVAQKADDEFKNIGSNLSDVMARVEKANRDGVRNVDEVLTPQEASIWRSLETELDTVRRRGSLGKKEIGEGDFGETYVPNEKVDQYPTRESLFEGFRATKPGNENVRTGAIDYDKLNFSPEVISGYVTRYADTKLLREERAFRAMQKNNPDLPEEQLRSATNKLIAVQDKVNALETKITLGGFGKKVTVNNGKKVDFAGEMSQIGKDIGKPQIVVDQAPRGFEIGNRVNSVMIDDNGQSVPIGTYLGINQHGTAAGIAGNQVKVAAGNRADLAQAVRERLEKAYRLPAEDVDYLVESVARIKPDLGDDLVTAQVTGIYRNAAKQQLIERSQTVDITNPTLKNDISDLSNQILREGTIEQKLSAQVISKTNRVKNAIFRKLNLSSALNEMSDMTSFYTVYGNKLEVAPSDRTIIKRYGVGDIDAAIEPYLKQIDEGADKSTVIKALHTLNDKTRLYKFVETYKASVFLTTAEKIHKQRGLTGDALTEAVLKDFKELALPVDMFTKTFLDDYPMYTQYLTWGARNMVKEGKLLRGEIDAGVMKDKTQAQRIARNLYVNIPAKTAFWLASNGLKGTAIMTAFGLTDFTGMTSQDYSGIAEEDKSFYDRTTQWTNMSTTMSILNTIYQAYEKEQLKNSDKYKNADYNPYENANMSDTAMKIITPQFIKNSIGIYDPSDGKWKNGAQQLNEMGYSENASGRVQYEAPTDIFDKIKSYAFGKNQTANARDYSGRKNLIERSGDNGLNPLAYASDLKDMALEQMGFQDTNYKRPLTDDYSKAYKELDKEARTAMLQGGRAYNGFFDDLKKNNPDQYNDYVKSMDGNHVSPEYWNTNSNGGKDLTNFKMMAERKKQLQKDFKTPYDPIYDLSDDQARSILAYKSAATGTDLALRNALYKEQWYLDYIAKRDAHYDSLPPAEQGEYDSTERVKQWNALDTQLGDLRFDKEATEVPAWAEKYPLVYERKKLEYGSPEWKAFNKAYYDEHEAQKEAYDKTQLNIINEMRKIEGVTPMSWEEYQQVTEVADTEDANKNGVLDSKEKSDAEYASKYGSNGGSGGGSSSGISPDAGGSYSHTGASKAAAVNKVKAKVVKIKPRTELKKITVKRSKSV